MLQVRRQLRRQHTTDVQALAPGGAPSLAMRRCRASSARRCCASSTRRLSAARLCGTSSNTTRSSSGSSRPSIGVPRGICTSTAYLRCVTGRSGSTSGISSCAAAGGARRHAICTGRSSRLQAALPTLLAAPARPLISRSRATHARLQHVLLPCTPHQQAGLGHKRAPLLTVTRAGLDRADEALILGALPALKHE